MPCEEPACADINGIHAAKGGGELACARKVNKPKLLIIIVAEALHFTLCCRYIITCCTVMCTVIKCTLITIIS